jgi:hypothetical protein
MAELIWAALIGVIKCSLIIIWLPFGLLLTYRICKNIIKAFMPARASSAHEAELDAKEGEIAELSPYQILGVTPGVRSLELNARYSKLMSANHPDKVAQLDPEIQAFASERTRRIIDAYQELNGQRVHN